MAGNLQPLDEKFAIVDDQGRPTLYFIKWCQQRQIDITEALTLLGLEEYLLGHQLQEGSGIQITPSGNLTDEPTIAADVQEILDQISTTRGTVLYRGLLGWAGLGPGTPGYVLQTNGGGADPTWAVPGGAGGGIFVAHNVAAPGDAFIDVLLDADNGYAYDVIVKGIPSANCVWQLRMSDDNGASFKSGASDYKSQGSGAASVCTLSITNGSGRRPQSQFYLTGMNVVATENFDLVGLHHGIDSGGSPATGSLGASPNALGPLNYNAFRVLCSAGNMNATTVWVKKII